MPLADDGNRVLQVLDDAECHRLLARAVLGRLAFTEGALPMIQPVSYVVSGGEVLIPTRVGSKVAAAARGAVVAFEVDDVDPVGRTGWNVTVIGPSRVVTDRAEVASLDRLGARAWAPADVPCYVAVRVAVIRGRRLTVPAAAAGGPGAPGGRVSRARLSARGRSPSARWPGRRPGCGARGPAWPAGGRRSS